MRLIYILLQTLIFYGIVESTQSHEEIIDEVKGSLVQLQWEIKQKSEAIKCEFDPDEYFDGEIDSFFNIDEYMNSNLKKSGEVKQKYYKLSFVLYTKYVVTEVSSIFQKKCKKMPEEASKLVKEFETKYLAPLEELIKSLKNDLFGNSSLPTWVKNIAEKFTDWAAKIRLIDGRAKQISDMKDCQPIPKLYKRPMNVKTFNQSLRAFEEWYPKAFEFLEKLIVSTKSENERKILTSFSDDKGTISHAIETFKDGKMFDQESKKVFGSIKEIFKNYDNQIESHKKTITDARNIAFRCLGYIASEMKYLVGPKRVTCAIDELFSNVKNGVKFQDLHENEKDVALFKKFGEHLSKNFSFIYFSEVKNHIVEPESKKLFVEIINYLEGKEPNFGENC